MECRKDVVPAKSAAGACVAAKGRANATPTRQRGQSCLLSSDPEIVPAAQVARRRKTSPTAALIDRRINELTQNWPLPGTGPRLATARSDEALRDPVSEPQPALVRTKERKQPPSPRHTHLRPSHLPQ